MPVLKEMAKPRIPDLSDLPNQSTSYSFPVFLKKTVVEHFFWAGCVALI